MGEKGSNKTLSRQSIERIYDFIGSRYDWFGAYEVRAKSRALELLGLSAGLYVLDIGVGTGKEHALIRSGVLPGGCAVGIDVSRVMLKVTQKRCRSPLCQADARILPFVTGHFDRLYSAYVMDILAETDLPMIFREFRRVLRPGGSLVVLSLTEGINRSSRAVVSAWKAVYAISPVSCAGCRPRTLAPALEEAGFCDLYRETIVQLAVPSEIVLAKKEL